MNVRDANRSISETYDSGSTESWALVSPPIEPDRQVELTSSTRESGAGGLDVQSPALAPDNCVVRNRIVRCHASLAAEASYASARSFSKNQCVVPGYV